MAGHYFGRSNIT
jgi:hypothetical protein